VTLVDEQNVAPEGLASSAKPPGASGDTARPNYMGPSGNGLVGADERGGKPAESRALSVCRPPLSVSRRRSRGLRKNAAVGRREARRSASWAGNPVR